MKLKVPTWIIKFIQNIYIHKYPFFIQYKPHHHKVKGFEVRRIMNNIKLGDILTRRFDGYLTTKFIPGFWSHSGMYIGKNKVIHATGKGVIIEDILDFCRTDSVGVYRLNTNNEYISTAIKNAKAMEKKHINYDYRFKNDNGAVYCTEMINEAYNKMFNDDFTIIAKVNVLTPDKLTKSKKLQEIITIKH